MAKKNEISKLDGMLSEFEDDSFLENVDSQDIVIPRLKLMQAMSDPVASGEARAGDVALNVDGHIYLEAGKTLEFIPLFYWHSRIMFQSLEAGGGILCRASDGKTGMGMPGGDCLTCQFKDWQTGENGQNVAPKCVRVHNFAILCPTQSGEYRMALLPLSKTSFRVGTSLLNRMRTLKGPIFAYSFQLTTEIREGGMSKYWAYNTKKWDETNRIDRRVDARPDWEPLFAECKEAAGNFRDMYRNGLISVDEPQNGNNSDDEEDTEVPF